MVMSVERPELPRPVALRKEGTEGLAIDWSDGHKSVYTWGHLRENCPCAACREERLKPPGPLRLLSPAQVASGRLAARAIQPVGHYAYRIVWNDGHDTGLFTLENLRELCQCSECQHRMRAEG
jgi:DUF971 family protein